jgi:prolyl oligopeptidase
MKKIFLSIILLVLLINCKNEPTEKKALSVNYPTTKTVDTVDTYFGVEVKDPYRWLEDDRSSETEAWVTSENKTTFDYLDQIPFRKEIWSK